MNPHEICHKCQTRYVRAEDVWKSGPNIGQRHTKCAVCMGITSKKAFPAHLLVPKDIQSGYQPSETVEQQWLAMLDAERESLLVHNDAFIASLPSGATLGDLPRATSNVHWDAILDRLRDIHSSEQLFEGFESVRTKYDKKSGMIAPIGLLAVSLNNCAVRSDLPSVLATNTYGTSSKAIAIPYAETDSCKINVDGTLIVPTHYRQTLLWVHRTVRSDGTRGPGQILFPNGHENVGLMQSGTSAELLVLLLRSFQNLEKEEWEHLRHKALDKLQKERAPTARARSKCQDIIDEKGRRSVVEPSDD
ncbi:hypothetical protein IQ07DRAFT_600371 [Pyrenochaeta sp. DS3sAY3a]|nr:hypothetical protein IQ07DRAFT_600371 [Pyrenochaeta sp. DS3sAY3a]